MYHILDSYSIETGKTCEQEGALDNEVPATPAQPAHQPDRDWNKDLSHQSQADQAPDVFIKPGYPGPRASNITMPSDPLESVRPENIEVLRQSQEMTFTSF